jgi:hypothetical protein
VCERCAVRAIGLKALGSGSAVYIMTSARDILVDVLLPSLKTGRFRRAALTMCRYSFEPIRLALAICRIESRLIPFHEGDCRDYRSWRLADTGAKAEQTFLKEESLGELMGLLSQPSHGPAPGPARRVGNIYEPFAA